ncbi:MAG TPA: hypothetical protein VFF73_16800 [Planctomycetota bacterium]|nr:hypothetical protein [Planctomycetota bacterium]
MPRRLDPTKGLPGLFAPGRPKTQEMSFLVAEKPARPKRTRKAVVEPPVPAPVPVPDYILLAPPFRAVPVAPPRPEPLRLGEIPALVSCAVGWIASLLRSER